MILTCADLDRVLETEDATLRAQFESHAAACTECRERLDLWSGMSLAAPLLRETWESSDLWERIEAAMTREAAEVSQPRVPGFVPRRFAPAGVLLALAAAALVVVLPVTLKHLGPLNRSGDRRLLTEKALDGVQRNEAAYIDAIEKLSELAGPALEAAESPLAMNYREKLKLIDAAIVECRTQAESNRFNAHLRAELLSMYQEKQRTLESVLEETPSDL